MRSVRSLRAALSLAADAFVHALAQQQAGAPARVASNHIQLEQYLDWEEVQNPQLSPDGNKIIFGRRWVDKMNDRWQTTLMMMNADGSQPRSLVEGSDVHWSPDGKRIAYVGKGEPTGSQIFIRYMDAEGASMQISHVTESPSSLEWS